MFFLETAKKYLQNMRGRLVPDNAKETITCVSGARRPLSQLFSTETRKVFLDEVGDVGVVADNVGVGHANIYVGTLLEQVG